MIFQDTKDCLDLSSIHSIVLDDTEESDEDDGYDCKSLNELSLDDELQGNNQYIDIKLCWTAKFKL